MTPGGFSFGDNWLKYLDEMPPEAIDRMRTYVIDWLGEDLSGERVADIGSGQGLTSLVAHGLGASVVSFDVDPLSVAATERMRHVVGDPDTWRVEQGSVLDPTFVASLGTFDLVVSWGVLHHTGHLWRALDAAASLVSPTGRMWIALYHRTPSSGRSLRTKRLYNGLPHVGQRIMRDTYTLAKVGKHLAVRRSLALLRASDAERGMSWRRDVEDWLGGLPYEVSSPGEVLARLRPQGFELKRLADAIGEGGNDVYLFGRRG